MAELVICDKEDIVEIADAVRNRAGTFDKMKLGEIVAGINGSQTMLDQLIIRKIAEVSSDVTSVGQHAFIYVKV